MSGSTLFSPIQIGRIALDHRVVMAPLTRHRANKAHVHKDLAVEYYGQRASTPGTLLITEATFIAPEADGYRNIPGIWSEEQVKAWKKVTDAVHSKRSFIFLQLWALGRAASPKVLKEEGNLPYVSSGNIKLKDRNSTPRSLTIEEIQKYTCLYATAASNAIKAGFDGVEIHAANGYLIDQFIQSVSNNRTDEYGGSVENRARFALEVVEAVTKAVGQDRTGIRFSPWSEFQDMREPNPEETFSYIVSKIKDKYPQLAYVHLVEPRALGDHDAQKSAGQLEQESNEFIRKIWQPLPLIVAGSYQPETAKRTVDEKNGLVAFGRLFISNPDLPKRIRNGIKLTPYDRDTFYTPENPKGYIDYPFADHVGNFSGTEKSRL